jgi:excisionase family DNA binding protein
MLTLDELCAWLNITERHARKLVERDAIPYRKVGHLLRFPETEIEEWSRPARKKKSPTPAYTEEAPRPPIRRALTSMKLPKSLIE